MVLSDSLSTLQVLEKLKTDYPLLVQLQDMFHKIEGDQMEIVFVWVPGHVDIRENETVDRAAKEALDMEPTDDPMPFSDQEPLTVKYVQQVWQTEWGKAVIVSNKPHEILPKLVS